MKYDGICAKCGLPLIKEYSINFPYGKSRAYICRSCCPPEKLAELWESKEMDKIMYKNFQDLDNDLDKAELTILLSTKEDTAWLEKIRDKFYTLLQKTEEKAKQYETGERSL